MPQRVAAIILNYNHPEDTDNCIKNIKKADTKNQVKIFIVDNSPPNLNRGFAKGVNRGLRQALSQGFEYFLIINPDVTVDKNFFKLLDNFKNKKVGLAAPAIRHIQNGKTMYGTDGYVDWRYAKATHYNQSSSLNTKIKNAQFVTFACVLLTKELILDIGFIDERYFMYCEDVDYCLTAKKAGFKIILDTSIVVDHNTSSSFDRPTQKLPISFKSQLKFIAKWLPIHKQVVPYFYHFFLYTYLYFLWSYHYLKKRGKKP